MKITRKIFLFIVIVYMISFSLKAQGVTISGDSTINQCEPKSYTISIQNSTVNLLTALVVTAKLENFTGFSYVSGTTSINVGVAPVFCTTDPIISGGYSGSCAPAPSAPYLTWDIDAQCGGPFTLNAGQTLNITFSLATDCDAVSGSLNTYIDYRISGTPFCDDTGAHSIQVLPGGLAIKKTPNVIPQELGQNVTWTLTVENTGFGIIENVVVTDVLGAGLDYVSSTPAGDNTGQTTTWDSGEIPGFASMNPGDFITIDITAQVIACEDLENNADVRWGCDMVTDCYNTADTIPPSTATASVQRKVKTPLIEYTLPNVSFNYCEDYVDVNFTITNIGDGRAHDVWLYVDFGSLVVSNISADAAYNDTEKRFELTNPLAAAPGPGNSYNLSYRLNYSSWCGGSFPSGDLVWQSLYKDDCDNEFYPPVKLSTINPPADSPSLSVGKTGAPSAIQIGETVVYNITSSYSGPLNCGSSTTSDITVVDTIPDGFSVVDSGGGTYVPGTGGTGGTITWTYTPPTSLNTSITIQAPPATECETYCFTLFTNTIQATGTDCCGCALSASSSQTTAIECEEWVDSEKTAVPTTGIRCDTIQYTNTYVFPDNAALDNVDLSQLKFQENADNEQEYDPGSLAITLSESGDITACALPGLTDTTPGPGGNLIINFNNCNTYGSVRNRTLIISYRLTITEDAVGACSGTTFYSWSALDLNISTGNQCLPDGIIYETTVVSVDAPDMSLSITGLGQIIHKCETQTITITLTQTSNTADPKDVRLVLSGLNYYVVNPGATVCSGAVAPTSCTPAIVGDDYIWYFADGFTGSGQNAVLQLQVQKRCTGSGDLVATAYFDDNCNDDDNYDDTCSATATETPALLLSGDLLIEKNPEVYYASTNTIQWKIYLTNRGSGTAYNVWFDDELGSGLDYVSAVVDNMTGVTVTADQDHNGNPINGCTIAIAQMAAGERREITFTALLIDCNNLTNNASTSWGCVGVDCQTEVTDSATGEIPSPLLINTNVVTTPVDACSTPVAGTITLRNAGQTTCYNLQITETLPLGSTYVSGTTRWRLNDGGWNGPNAAYDPNPTTSPLQWTSTEIAGLAVSNPGDTIEIEYELQADCPFTGGNVTVSTAYENPCGQLFNTADSVFTVAFREPNLTISKTRINEPIDCGDLVEWFITVENTSGYTLPIIWVEDTLGAAFTFQSSVGDPPFTSDNGTFDGTNTVAWELRNVNHNDTVTLTIRATADNPPCSTNLDNTVNAWWGCGAADGDSSTKPGIDFPDDTLCLTSTAVSATNTPTREPTIGFLDITVNPVSLDSCSDNTQLTVTIENTGPTDAENVDLVITLPAGLTYNAGSSTVTCGGVTNPTADPAVSGNQLTYYDITDNATGKANNLCDTVQASGGNDTVVLVFSVHSNCYVTADMRFDLYYYDCCEDTQYSTTDSETITALYPNLSITKVPVNSQVNCNSNQTWTITVTNNGTGNAQVVRIEDRLGDWIDYIGSNPAATSMGGQVYGWEINNLGPGSSQVFTITGQLNPDAPQADCTALLRQDNVRTIWGCGVAGDAVDGDPTTQAYDCTHTNWVNAAAAALQMPDLVVTNITPVITCNADGSFSGSITVTVQNQGDGNSVSNFTVEITDGKGWTGTGTNTGNVAPGASVDVTIDVLGWDPVCQPCALPYTFNVTNVDLNDDVCECNEGNNTFGPVTYVTPIPDLVVSDIDFTNVSCTNENISGSVSVIVTNTGCAGAANFQVYLTTDGCFSFGNQTVLVPLGPGASTTVLFPITPPWVDCTDCTCQFTAAVDPTNVVCECDGTNNQYTESYTQNLPDLRVNSVTPSVTCVSDGNLQGTVTVNVENIGCADANNVVVRLISSCGFVFPDQAVNLAASTNTNLTFNFTPDCSVCTCIFIALIDPDNLICECSGTNNAMASLPYTINVPDIMVDSDTLAITCSGSEHITVSGTVTLANLGCGLIFNATVPMRFTLYDNTGCSGNVLDRWTQNFSPAIIFPGGGTQAFVITPRTIDTNICNNSTNCQVSIRVEADYSDTICECDGTNNTYCSDNKVIDIPDIEVTNDTLTVTCLDDGQVTVSGSVTLVNNGCGSNLTANIPMRFTLYDNNGCGGSQLGQWDQTFTGVNMASGGGTQVFTITPQTINTDLCANSSSCQVSIRVEADYTNSICECDGTDNTYCADNKAVDITDLQVQSDTLGVSCTSDGQVSISGTVTMTNTGCGANLTADIPVRFTLFDNTGCTGNQLLQWTQTFTGINIASGSGTQVFTMTPQNLTTNLVTNSNNCRVSILIEPDYTGAICECDSTNNNYCADNKPVDIPDIEVQTEALDITCTDDGQYSITGTVTLVNNGCGSNLNANVPIRFTLHDNTGDGCTGDLIEQWTEIFTGVNIAPGAAQTFTITPHNAVDNLCSYSIQCLVTLLVEADYNNTICESDGTDNTLCIDKILNSPELTINSLASTVVCLDDGNLAGTTVNVSNTGCGEASGVVIRLNSDCGLTFADQTVNLAAGETRDVFFPFTAGITICTCSFTATIDPDNSICECDGTNNTRTFTQDMLIPDLEVQDEDLLVTCLDDGVIRVSGTVTLVNNGCGPDFTDSIPMRFTLLNRIGCSGSPINQWTQTFTGVSIASAGGTQTYNIQPHDINTNFCTNSSSCQVSILIEADYSKSICEWDGTDNTYCTNKTSDCLDLETASVTANTNCAEDANLNGTIAVTVRNSGRNPITRDFYVRVDDGKGWSSELRYNADLGGTLPVAAGATSIVTFAWNRNFDTDTCDYTNITAQVDSQNEICQCTTENDIAAASFQMPHPNLKPTAVNPICSVDGSYTVGVTIENNGCSDTGSFTVHLEDNLGNSMDIIVNSLAKGISTTVDFNEWPASCDPASVTFTATVDANNDVCEITGTDNTMELVYTNTSPDLVITGVKPSTTCRAPGDIIGAFEITLQNNGNGPVTQDFKVIVDDAEGWSTAQFYQADLEGNLPIAVSETITLRINWNRDFNKEPYRCNFNNIIVSLDVQTSICECAASNNEMIAAYRLPHPDLVLQSLSPICSEDGQRQLQLTIGNNGCEDQKEDFNIIFSDNRGGTRTASFTSMGGTLPLKKGSPQTVILAGWEFDCTTAATDYTAAISHEGGGCDLLDTNNTLTLTHTTDEPDLLFGDIQWTCNANGSITFTVTVSNNGFSDADGVPVHIYDGSGSLVYNQTLDLPKGTQKQFTFTTGGFPQDQNLTFRFVVDKANNYCECNGSNNEKSISFICQSTGEEPQLKISKSCPPGQQPGGLFRFEIQVENTGGTDITNARIEDFLPQGFQYVSDSSALNGQSLSDPQISDRLTWSIGTLKAGESMTLVFSAVADADIDPGRYCNETQAVATFYGDTVTVTSDKVQCCTVVVRQTRAGCCLKVEGWALEPGQIPDGPISFIEPYFHTESAMFTIYSIFNLWQDTELEKGTMPLFMKERLHNYARSTIEEFYLGSRLGLTLPDGSLWLSYAGAYPERKNSWVRKQVDETMTASQIGFELLALDKAAKIEERREIKQKLKDIIEKKLNFLTYFIDDLPHAWEIKGDEVKAEVEVKVEDAIEKHVKKQDEKATLYDKVALYLALVELKKSGYSNANIENFEEKLRDMLKNIDNQDFDGNNLREEFLFTLALLEAGQTGQAKSKIKSFEDIYIGATKVHKETQRELLDTLHDHALAAAVDYKANGTVYEKIMQQANEKFYLKDTGVFAEKQPDFTFKLKLHSLAPLILAFNTKEPEKQENYASILYRTFDEVGLFLKKRNLSVGKPLYSLLKNYSFTEPLLPVLNFTKANQDIAPVFSKDAVIHSTQLKPIGEILIPQTFSKILSPSYETSASRIAAVSFGLQYFGKKLMEKGPWVIKEEGRSFNETGKNYVDSLLKSGAGIQYNSRTLLPFDDLAIKGPKKGEHNLEPLNAGNGAQISTETLANYLLAEKLYVQGNGKYADTVLQIMVYQDQVVKQFKDAGYIPEKFTIFIENDTEKITVIPSKTKATKLTAAKLFHVLSKDDNHKFLESAFKKTQGKLTPEDMIFLAAVPELVPYFEKEIQTLVDYKDSRVSYNAADIIGRKLLGDNPDKIRWSLENLKKHWDKEAVLPKSDLIENIERGLIYHHEPQQLLLYLLASHEAMDFRFERTLNFFTYLLENEWGVAWNSFITLPSARFLVFREEPKEHVEPGDLLTFRVRVDNTCPEGFGSAHDLPSLYLKAAFTPSLIYAGTQRVDGLDVLGDFQWRYSGLVEGSVLEYLFQALVPKDFSTNFIDGWIYAGGRQGFEEFGPGSGVGSECEDIDQVRRLNIIPLEEIQGLVYEDLNVNNIKDVGERGIPNILIKDTRGRFLRSDGEGRFTILAGDKHEGIQVELKSIPANYLLISKPTQLVNRNYTGEIYFGLIPCKIVTGFVYVDENKNDAYNEGEVRPEGVLLKAKDKEVITGKDGKFIFRNLPVLWQQWIEVKQEQLYYKGSINNLKFNIQEK